MKREYIYKSISLSKEEDEYAKKMAERFGISQNAVIRRAVRLAYAIEVRIQKGDTKFDLSLVI